VILTLFLFLLGGVDYDRVILVYNYWIQVKNKCLRDVVAEHQKFIATDTTDIPKGVRVVGGRLSMNDMASDLDAIFVDLDDC